MQPPWLAPLLAASADGPESASESFVESPAIDASAEERRGGPVTLRLIDAGEGELTVRGLLAGQLVELLVERFVGDPAPLIARRWTDTRGEVRLAWAPEGRVHALVVARPPLDARPDPRRYSLLFEPFAGGRFPHLALEEVTLEPHTPSHLAGSIEAPRASSHEAAPRTFELALVRCEPARGRLVAFGAEREETAAIGLAMERASLVWTASPGLVQLHRPDVGGVFEWLDPRPTPSAPFDPAEPSAAFLERVAFGVVDAPRGWRSGAGLPPPPPGFPVSIELVREPTTPRLGAQSDAGQTPDEATPGAAAPDDSSRNASSGAETQRSAAWQALIESPLRSPEGGAGSGATESEMERPRHTPSAERERLARQLLEGAHAPSARPTSPSAEPMTGLATLVEPLVRARLTLPPRVESETSQPARAAAELVALGRAWRRLAALEAEPNARVESAPDPSAARAPRSTADAARADSTLADQLLALLDDAAAPIRALLAALAEGATRDDPSAAHGGVLQRREAAESALQFWVEAVAERHRSYASALAERWPALRLPRRALRRAPLALDPALRDARALEAALLRRPSTTLGADLAPLVYRAAMASDWATVDTLLDGFGALAADPIRGPAVREGAVDLLLALGSAAPKPTPATNALDEGQLAIHTRLRAAASRVIAMWSAHDDPRDRLDDSRQLDTVAAALIALAPERALEYARWASRAAPHAERAAPIGMLRILASLAPAELVAWTEQRPADAVFAAAALVLESDDVRGLPLGYLERVGR